MNNQIAREARRSDIQAVLRRHYRSVFSFVAARIPRKLIKLVDVDDIVQDVCIEAIRCFDSTEVIDEASWLLTIARRQMIDLIRSHRTLKRGAGRVIGEDCLSREDRSTVVMLQDLVVYRRTPSASAIRREVIIALEKALKSISEPHRNVVNMRYLDGLSSAQAAGLLGLTEDAVRQLAKRALAAIRVELQYLVIDY